MIRIMLVEDNPDMQQTLKRLLSQHFAGVEIFVAASVEEAEILASVVDPQLIFMDVSLPDGSGLALAERLQKIHGKIPVAFLSSSDTPEYREAALGVGASHYLGKGTASDQDIVAVVQSVLDRGDGVH